MFLNNFILKLPFIENIVFVFDPKDIKSISTNENFARFATSKCPVTNTRNILLQLANKVIPLQYNNVYHSALYDNDDKRFRSTKYIEQVLKKRITKKELKELKQYLTQKDISKIKRFMLYIVFRRILKNNDIHDLIDDIMNNINNRNELEKVTSEMLKYTTKLPQVELLFIISLLYNTVANYIYETYYKEKDFTKNPKLPITVRVCVKDCKIGNLEINKNSIVVLLIGYASKLTGDYRYTFGTGSDFRKCRFTEFFVDIVGKLSS